MNKQGMQTFIPDNDSKKSFQSLSNHFRCSLTSILWTSGEPQGGKVRHRESRLFRNIFKDNTLTLEQVGELG